MSFISKETYVQLGRDKQEALALLVDPFSEHLKNITAKTTPFVGVCTCLQSSIVIAAPTAKWHMLEIIALKIISTEYGTTFTEFKSPVSPKHFLFCFVNIPRLWLLCKAFIHN